MQCLAPTSRIQRLTPDRSRDALAAWRITVDSDAEPVAQPDDVTLTEFSTGAAFAFHRRG